MGKKYFRNSKKCDPKKLVHFFCIIENFGGPFRKLFSEWRKKNDLDILDKNIQKACHKW